MIDYYKIADAVSHYSNWGYKLVDAPWFVTREAMQATSPSNVRYCNGFLGDLVASGEQSFIQMWMDKKLGDGKYQCVTPCFRDESVIDSLHLNYFMKVELIEVFPVDSFYSLEEIIESALSFFCKYTDVNVVDTEIGKDIVSLNKGTELGSYGIRGFRDFKWIYGTGCAEPRLSQVVNENLGK